MIKTMAKNFIMSFFKAPLWNKRPHCVVSLYWLWLYVTMKYLQIGTDADRDPSLVSKTAQLRAITDGKAQRKLKESDFDYVTPAGTFSYCDDCSLTEASDMICIDLDHLDDDSEQMKRKITPDEMKMLLLSDPYFGAKTLLMFTSPRGHGVKWFVEIDRSQCDFKSWFLAIRNYLIATYGLGEKQVDPSVGNVSRACLISYDPDAYLRADQYETFNIA